MKNSSYDKVVSCCKGTNSLLYAVIFVLLFSSCSVSKQIGKQAKEILQQDPVIGTGQIGICIYEPAANKYLYNYNATKYFIPASNTKLFTLYAGMKYLGDSLVGLRYTENNVIYPDTTPITDLVKIFPTGDPTFLNSEFSFQPVFEFLKKQKRFEICDFNEIKSLGKGWAWEDYMETFMTPRSSFPIYRNSMTLKFIKKDSILIEPGYFKKEVLILRTSDTGFSFFRNFSSNKMGFLDGKEQEKKVPICSAPVGELLEDTLKQQYVLSSSWLLTNEDLKRKYKIIHSQPSDSLFKPMMHRSDNFYAEQTLLMAGNERLGFMNDEAIIDTILNTDLKDVPQKPRWVDGSGLSRYNLFTPQSFVYILNKMKNEFGLERLKVILPTGGDGTLKNYYNSDSGFIYAKTGSLSNQVAISGYLLTRKNKLLVFSVLVNNVMGSTADVRRAIQQFISGIRNKY